MNNKETRYYLFARNAWTPFKQTCQLFVHQMRKQMETFKKTPNV